MIERSGSNAIVDRMIRAARLDNNLYEEVEADTTATRQAALVVVIVAVASAIGGAIAGAMAGDAGAILGSLIGGIVSGLLGWVVWSYITYFVGTSLFGGTATPGEMLRTIGFANSPGVLNVLSFIPIVGGIISLVVFFWLLAAGIIAVRQALDFSTGKAIMTAVIGWIGLLIVTFAVGAVLTVLGLGVRALTF
jgi:hypothetical protein